MNKINQGIILFKMNRSLLSDYFSENQTKTEFRNCDSWVILSPIEQSIKRKIEEVGTPLKDWNINIYRGILTGYNEAFIISGEKRTELLAACGTEKERIRTDELIRPILRGRDIKRYTYEFADLYIIATFPAKHYNIDDYPAIKAHLLSYGIERLEQTGKEYTINGEKIKARKKTNNQWFETQDSISYWDDFNKQKIVWGNLNLTASFAYAPEGMYINAPATMIVPYDKAILAILNSKLADYYIRNLGVTRNGGYFEYKPMFIEKLPIPSSIQSMELDILLDQQLNGYDVENQINQKIYEIFDLSIDEIKVIEGN